MKYGVILLLFALLAPASGDTLQLTVKDKEDYGSGPVSQGTYFPGGLGGNLGILAGHANALAWRKDRILIRFYLGDLYLKEQLPQIKSARLKLNIYFVANTDPLRTLSVYNLLYDPAKLSVMELNSDNVQLAGTAPNLLKKHPPEGNDGEIVIDAGSAVQYALEQKFLYLTFRITDSAELTTNTTRRGICTIIQSPALGKGKNPTLIIDYQ